MKNENYTPGFLDEPLRIKVYVGPEMIFKIRAAFALKANSSVGSKLKSMDTFYPFLTVPN